MIVFVGPEIRARHLTMARVDARPVTGAARRAIVRPSPSTPPGRNPPMILGDLIVLIVTVVPIVLTVLALRANPLQLVELFGPAVR
jgi:hypothetical protein